MEKELFELLRKYWNYLNNTYPSREHSRHINLEELFDWLWQRDLEKEEPKTDTTPSSDKDRLKELEKEYWTNIQDGFTDPITDDVDHTKLWHWILSHAKELGELV